MRHSFCVPMNGCRKSKRKLKKRVLAIWKCPSVKWYRTAAQARQCPSDIESKITGVNLSGPQGSCCWEGVMLWILNVLWSRWEEVRPLRGGAYVEEVSYQSRILWTLPVSVFAFWLHVSFVTCPRLSVLTYIPGGTQPKHHWLKPPELWAKIYLFFFF